MPNKLMARVSQPGEYSHGFMIEQYIGYDARYPDGWGVPAWEEQGLAELVGPFPTAEKAHEILSDVLQYV